MIPDSGPGLVPGRFRTKQQTMIVFFDCETTGLPRNFAAPAADTDNWPRLVELALLVFDADGHELDSIQWIVYPDGYEIPAQAAAIHGITTQIAKEKGRPIEIVLAEAGRYFMRAEVVVAHNIAFDEKIVGAEYIRARMEDPLLGKAAYCTMNESKAQLNLFKRPKLIELHQALFGEGFDGAHGAMADIEATARCYWELKRLAQEAEARALREASQQAWGNMSQRPDLIAGLAAAGATIEMALDELAAWGETPKLPTSAFLIDIAEALAANKSPDGH
jgi:DNA polymerase III subunit epsilon